MRDSGYPTTLTEPRLSRSLGDGSGVRARRNATQSAWPACTTRGSVRPVHAFRYTSRAVNGLASRPCVSWAASSAAATCARSVTLA
jgi:hypothetical protein